MTDTLRIVGIDPGLEYVGFCLIDAGLVWPGRLLDLSVIVTPASDKKLGLREKSDDLRRCCRIYDEVVQRIVAAASRHARQGGAPLDVLAFEECPSLRSSKVTRKVAMAWGTVLGGVRALNPSALVFEGSPQRVKQVVAGSNKAAKKQVEGIVDRCFPNARSFGIPDGRFNHAADAVAVALWARQEDTIKWRLQK